MAYCAAFNVLVNISYVHTTYVSRKQVANVTLYMDGQSRNGMYRARYNFMLSKSRSFHDNFVAKRCENWPNIDQLIKSDLTIPV